MTVRAESQVDEVQAGRASADFSQDVGVSGGRGVEVDIVDKHRMESVRR